MESSMTTFNFISIALDAHSIIRGAPELLAKRQTERLNELVTIALFIAVNRVVSLLILRHLELPMDMRLLAPSQEYSSAGLSLHNPGEG
jgi:hypothetical protein